MELTLRAGAGLKGPICLHASKPKKTQTEFCSKESEGLLVEKVAHTRDTGELILRDPAPRWLPGDGYTGEAISPVTKGVRVVSGSWSLWIGGARAGVIGHCIWSRCQPWPHFVWFCRLLGLERKHTEA